MDVMKPELVWAAGGCYRFCDSNVWKSSEIEECLEAVDAHNRKRETAVQGARRGNFAPELKSGRENAVLMEEEKRAPVQILEKESCPSTIMRHGTVASCIGETKERVVTKNSPPRLEIKQIASGYFRCVIYVAQRYFPFLIGAGGSLKYKLQRETHTTIDLDDSECMITAAQKSSIFSAVGRIHGLIARARTKVEPYHCLSIPLIDETIKTNYGTFKDAVLDKYADDTDVQRNLVFMEPETLHLKLGKLLLVDEREKNAAFATLEEWKETIMMPIIEKNGPVRIIVEGLDYVMKEKLQSYVIYGKVSSENNVLQELAQKTANLFIEEGLMILKRRQPQLYMELLHVPIAVDKKKDCPGRENIASDIVTSHKDHFFGKIELSTVHLSHCLKFDVGGYYAAEAEIGV